jgi:hypothetical protein
MLSLRDATMHREIWWFSFAKNILHFPSQINTFLAGEIHGPSRNEVLKSSKTIEGRSDDCMP